MSVKHLFIFVFFVLILNVSNAEQTLAPISITASRTDIPVEKVSGALTIITRQEIEQRNAVFVSDLLQSVPGVNVSRSGGSGALTQIRLRGAEANQVLVIIDGIEVNDPAIGSEFNFAHLPTHNIERIEILRGPQSALWGSDALAGVINIITQQADAGKHINAKSSYGSDNSYEGSVNASYARDAFDFSLGANFIDTDGINIASVGNERDGYDNVNLNLNTNIQLLDNVSIGFNSRYINATNEFDSGFGSPLDNIAETDIEQVYARAFIKASFYNNRWTHQLETAISDTDNQSIDNFFGFASRTAATREKFIYQTTFHIPENLPINPRQSITLALEREQERFVQSLDLPNQRQKITNYGYIVEYRNQLTNKLLFTGAVRFDDNDEFDDRNTFRAGLTYQPNDSSHVYVTYATGVKNPTFTELFGFAPTSFIGNSNLTPESSESWEIGLSHAFINNALNVELAIFQEDLVNEIQTVFFPDFSSTTVNSSQRSERHGLEFNIAAQITPALILSGSFTYLDAQEPDISGNRQTEIRRPKNQWSGQINYRFLDDRANLNINVDYVGDRRDLDFDLFQRTTLDAYTRIDLAFDYQLHSKLKLFAQIRNLLDEEYQEVFGFETEEFSGFAGFEVSL